MELKIVEEKKNGLFSRKEVRGELMFEQVTPSNNEVQTVLAKKLSVTPEQVVVEHIYTDFGTNHAKFSALVYDSAEHKKKFVWLGKAVKEKMKKAAEAAKAAAPEQEASA